MNYRTLGRTGLRVSELGFGALEIGRNWPYWRKEMQDFLRPTESEAIRVLDMAVDLGINFFDTAPAYFKSEEILGKAFKRKRNSVFIATKCGEWFDGERSVYDYSAAETLKFIESSLRLLQTDHIDLLQIHSASPDVVRSGETLGAMKKARKDGKVRFLGISTDQVEAARLAIESSEYDSIQVTYNVLQPEFSREIFPLAEKEKVGVIIKGGLGAGELTSKFTDIPENQKREKIASLKRLADKNEVSIQEIALRFALSHPTVSTLIAGTKNPAHLKSNCEASLKGALDTSLMEQLSLSLHSE